MDISRRDMFKQLLGKESLQTLSIFLPGSLERLLGVGLPGSAEEAGLALSRRRPNRSLKLTDCTGPKNNSSKSKTEALEASASEEVVIPG